MADQAVPTRYSGGKEEQPCIEDAQRTYAFDTYELGEHTTNATTVTAAPVQYRVYKRRWIGLVVLVIMNIAVSWGWLTFSPVSKHTAKWFSLSSESPVNWLSTVILFVYCIATPVVIYIVRRYSMKPTLLAAAFLLLAGNWIRYAGVKKQAFAVTMFGQMLIGFCQPFVLSVSPHYSDLWFTSRGRVSATAVVSLSNPFGAALAQLINPMVATKPSDLPNMVLYISIMSSAATLGWGFFPKAPPTPVSPSAHSPKATAKDTVRVFTHSRDFWLLLIMFSIYLGLFNVFSTLLNQLMYPRGYSSDDAGLIGALLIGVGLVSAAIISPIIDRTRAYMLTVRVCVPVIAACYIALVFAPRHGMLAPPMIVAAVLGAASFCLLPLALELGVEYTHPVAPEWTSSLMWCGGQLMGGVLIVGMGEMKSGKDDDMTHALILQAVLAAVAAPGVFLLRAKGGMRRLGVDMGRGETAAISGRRA